MAPPGSAPQGAAEVVARTLNEVQPGLVAHRARCGRFDKAYDVWRARENPNERKGRPDWQPLLKVKYGMQVVDQTTVAVAQGVPKARCTPRNEASVGKAKAMEQILGYYTDQAHLPEKQPLVVQQALVYGVSPAKTSWLYREADRQMLVPAVDPMTGEILWQAGNQRIVECDRPNFEPWDVYDIWWDPTAVDPDHAEYVVLRCWPSKAELQRGAYNEDTGTGRYSNLDRLFAAGPGEERPTTAQNALLDDAPKYRDRFEVWEVWRDDRLTVIGNRQVLLYDGPKPFWMPGKPITISHSRPDFFRIEGISETELVDHIQQALWATDNLRLENQRFSVQRGATVRETVPDMKALVMQPHFLWPVTDHDDVRFVDQPHLPPEAYREHEVLLSDLQLATGISAYVTGASGQSNGADQTTATGVSLLSGAAGRLLSFKAEQISRNTWQRTFEQMADLTRQFLRREISVAILGPGEQTDWVTIGPADVFGDYDIRIEAAEESMQRNQRRAEAIALLNALAPYAAQGLIDPKPLFRQVAEAYGFPSPEALIPAAQPAMPPAAPNQQVGAGPPPLTLGGQVQQQPPMAIMAGNASG